MLPKLIKPPVVHTRETVGLLLNPRPHEEVKEKEKKKKKERERSGE